MTRLRRILVKNRGKPIIGFSVYDYFGAKIVKQIPDIDFILIGDSLSMVFKGKPDVKNVSMDEMLYHLKIVRDVIDDKPIVLDMPYGSYEEPSKAIKNALKALESGADGIMIEGLHIPTMKTLHREGIDYMVHLGYQPKYHPNPIVVKDYKTIMYEALTCQDNGALAIKLEAVKPDITRKLRESLKIPVLGVGSGPHVDGHLLVLYDFIGMYPEFKAKFVRKYVDLYGEALKATKKLVSDILEGRYPSKDETY